MQIKHLACRRNRSDPSARSVPNEVYHKLNPKTNVFQLVEILPDISQETLSYTISMAFAYCFRDVAYSVLPYLTADYEAGYSRFAVWA